MRQFTCLIHIRRLPAPISDAERQASTFRGASLPYNTSLGFVAHRTARLVHTKAPFNGKSQQQHSWPPSSVEEVARGISAGWVPDALGYHLMPNLRDRHTLRSTNDEAAEENHQKESDTVTDAEISVRRSAEKCDDCHNSFSAFFLGPVKVFEASPVFEWAQCLWQWRPVEVRPVHGRHASQPQRECSLSDFYCAPRDIADDGDASSSVPSNYYLVPFLLLPTGAVPESCPRLHADLHRALLERYRAEHPHDDEVTRGNATTAYADMFDDEDGSSDTLPPCSSLHTASKSFHRGTAVSPTIVAPSPVGLLRVEPIKMRDAAVWATFTEVERWLVQRGSRQGLSGQRGPQQADRDHQRPAPSSTAIPDSPSAEIRKATTQAWPPRENQLDEVHAPMHNCKASPPYVRIFVTDYPTSHSADSPSPSLAGKQQLHRRHSNDDLGTRSPPALSRLVYLPPMRCNVLGGGLAELILAIDRYAALLARDELTLSAACWATLCDTKSWSVVQRLRVCPREVERELVAATAAHRRWQQRAVQRHRTLVGKSSHGIGFWDYPLLARWMRS